MRNEIDSKIILLYSAYTVYIMGAARRLRKALFSSVSTFHPPRLLSLSRRKKVFVENFCGAQKKNPSLVPNDYVSQHGSETAVEKESRLNTNYNVRISSSQRFLLYSPLRNWLENFFLFY